VIGRQVPPRHWRGGTGQDVTYERGRPDHRKHAYRRRHLAVSTRRDTDETTSLDQRCAVGHREEIDEVVWVSVRHRHHPTTAASRRPDPNTSKTVYRQRTAFRRSRGTVDSGSPGPEPLSNGER